MQNPAISVIIPVYNEDKYIEKCLKSFLENVTCLEYELLIIDGGSTDTTLSIISNLQLEYPIVRVLENKYTYTPYALNIGAKEARGKYLIIFGAHSFPENNFLQKSYDTIVKTNVDCVGGRVFSVSLSLEESDVVEDIKNVLSSFFGVGNARFRYSDKPGYVETVPFGCYRKEIFEKIGYFDEEFIRNQDDEFNHRLIQKGGKIYYNPQIVSYYYVRNDLHKLSKQYYQYGYWKVLVQKKRKAIASIRHLIPALFVSFIFIGGSLSFFYPVIRSFYLGVLLLYIILAFLFSLRGRKSLISLVRTPFIFFVVHFSYGLGYLMALFDIIFKLRPANKIKNNFPDKGGIS